MVRRIETEEQYQKSLEWLVKEAERLENEEEVHDPLMLPEKREELMTRYKFVAAGVLDYQSRERCKWDPNHVYEPPEEPKPKAPAQEPEPVTEPEPEMKQTDEPQVDLSSWLDDD